MPNPETVPLICYVYLKMVPIEVKQNSCWAPVQMLILTSNTILFVDLPFTNIHASCSHFLNPLGSGVNLIDITPIITLFDKQTPWSCLPGYYLPKRENQLFVSSHSCHPPLREALQSHGGGGEVCLCRKLI